MLVHIFLHKAQAEHLIRMYPLYISLQGESHLVHYYKHSIFFATYDVILLYPGHRNLLPQHFLIHCPILFFFFSVSCLKPALGLDFLPMLFFSTFIFHFIIFLSFYIFSFAKINNHSILFFTSARLFWENKEKYLQSFHKILKHFI